MVDNGKHFLHANKSQLRTNQICVAHISKIERQDPFGGGSKFVKTA